MDVPIPVGPGTVYPPNVGKSPAISHLGTEIPDKLLALADEVIE
jgi:hypothetical protein